MEKEKNFCYNRLKDYGGEYMRVAAVAFDMDDTLLRDDLSISDYTVSVLSRAMLSGVVPRSRRTRLKRRW